MSYLKLFANTLICFFSRDSIFSEKIINKIFVYLNLNSKKAYYTYHARPLSADNVHIDKFLRVQHPEVGVIIQGPIKRENDFTFESALLYKKTMPGALIVISTWDDEHLNETFLKKHNISVIKSQKPKTSGLGTTNYQIVSTINAIKYLKKMGCKYVVKTRSDQRVYGQNLIPFFLTLLYQFPSVNLNQNNRIIELSMNVCRYRPYSMCDMFQFGHLADLELMWGVVLDPRNQSTNSFSRIRRTSRDVSESFIGEIYIHRNYLKTIGASDEVSLKTFYKNLVDHFIIIDKEQVDLFWYKYNAMEYGIAENPLYDVNRQKSRIYFRDWLVMNQYGVDSLSTDDGLMDRFEN